jgi:hypothetical protein
MGEEGHRAVEAAARGDIPERYARPLGILVRGDRALVVLGTNEPPWLYPCLVFCERGDDGLWHEAGSEGPGVGHTDWEGATVLCEEAPPGAATVIVRYGGEDYEVGVEAGWFTFVSWERRPGRPELVGVSRRAE